MHLVRLLREVGDLSTVPGEYAERRHRQLPRGQPPMLDADPVRQRTLVERGERDRQDRSDDDHGARHQGRGEQVRHDRQELRCSRWQENTHPGANIEGNIFTISNAVIMNLV